jgi:hypothetical protein
MTENYNYLFFYLDKEEILLDKSEFLFQIQSHPDYPSLLSIADTLSFFKINNGATPATISEIELLPERFVASLKEEKNNHNFTLLRKKEKLIF